MLRVVGSSGRPGFMRLGLAFERRRRTCRRSAARRRRARCRGRPARSWRSTRARCRRPRRRSRSRRTRCRRSCRRARTRPARMPSAAAFMIAVPVRVSPVKVIAFDARDGGSGTRRPSRARSRARRCRRPSARRPCSSPRRAASRCDGVSSDGFTTTVLPQASAGPDLPGHEQQRQVPRADHGDHALAARGSRS